RRPGELIPSSFVSRISLSSRFITSAILPQLTRVYNSIMKQVYFDNDAGVDDLLSVILLLGMNQVEVLGIGVTPADCYLETGLEATLKILQMLGRTHIPVAGGTLAGRHAFPHAWRVHSDLVNALPILNRQPHPPPAPIPAHEQLIARVRAASGPVTLLF